MGIKPYICPRFYLYSHNFFKNHVQYHFNFSRINKIARGRLKYKYGQRREYFSKITKEQDIFSVHENKIFERKTFCRIGGVHCFLWKPFLLVEAFIWCETWCPLI